MRYEEPHEDYSPHGDGDGEKISPVTFGGDGDGNGESFFPTGMRMGKHSPMGNSPLTSLVHYAEKPRPKVLFVDLFKRKKHYCMTHKFGR
jgi:hypothetical protein